MDELSKLKQKSGSCDGSAVAADPALDRLVEEIIGRVADKWTMIILEVLNDHGTVRFSQIAKLVPDISQKMLTKTLRLMERDGLLVRTIHPVVPPHVDYCLTDLGKSLGGAFCGVWLWAEEHHVAIERARSAFDSEENTRRL
jgi:DNA-binding HxlR family transcriptional regulator